MTAPRAGGATHEDIRVDLVIPRDEYLRYYSGLASVVIARARDGRMIQFPASLLRNFVGHDGVRGTFVLRCTADGRLVTMERAP